MSDSDSDDQGAQVRVSLRLANSVQDRSLEVPTEPIAVPAEIGRKGLSAVLNHLLGRSIPKGDEDDDVSDDDSSDSDKENLPPLSFEFIVKGTNNRLLRKGVEKEARQYGLSLEEPITITYFPAANVPQRKDDEETLPDWVSCLASSSTNNTGIHNIVVSGCYDGSIHAYKRNPENNSLTKVDFTGDGTVGPIKAMATTRVEDKVWIAAASMDHSLNIHTFDDHDGKGKLRLHGECVLAENEVGSFSSGFTSLDYNTANLLASGNGNGRLSLWNVRNVVENHSSAMDKKRQKGSSSKKVRPSTSSKPEIAAVVHFENAHSQSVTGLSWGNHHKIHNGDNGENEGNAAAGTHLISGSWDHSIKLWDVEKQNCLITLNGARVVSCLDTSYHTEGVVATGHPDCTIRLWDVRANISKPNTMLISDNTFRPSHKAWVSSVQWNRSNAYQLASTSHDGNIKVWDIRSSNPLHTIRAFPKGEKSLSLLWLSPFEGNTNQAIYAGGTDCIIKRLET